jgi:2-hydroxychromene-2-carboxylate isomerase
VIDFYYGLGSRYSYLASTQIARLEAETGCRVRWRPLYSADLFTVRGADPFQGRPVSGQYDWAYRRRDAEAWAEYYDVPYREPVDVRFEGRQLALAATAAGRLGAVERFSRALFEAVFVRGTSPLDAAALGAMAVEVALDPGRWAEELAAPETAQALGITLREALAAGAFGVPSFVVGGAVFWGNDRLPLVRHRLRKGSEAAPAEARQDPVG